jgi:phosphate transport system protein
MIDEKVAELKKGFLDYTNLLENILWKTKDGLLKRKPEKLKEVIEVDELKVNATEIEIDEMCMSVIAQFQPKAKNLRTIMMISKINNDMERIGDQAVNIAQSGLYMLDHERFLSLIDMSDIFEGVIKMYRNSIQSFMEEDVGLAREVCEYDDIVDQFNSDTYQKLKGEMKEDPGRVSPSLQLMRIARNLERIADHATNIAEDVVYMVEGLVLKHNYEE